MKHKKEAVLRDFWISAMILALDTSSSDLILLNSIYIPKETQELVFMRLTKHAIPIHLVLNTAVMDGSHWDAGGLRAKVTCKHGASFLTARAKPQKLHIAKREKNTAYLWSEWQQSWLEQWPPTREWSWALPKAARPACKAPHEAVEGHEWLQGHVLATPAL